ncbi:MAG: IS1595 family transposase [Paludibacteraceae bacterium]|nr:IS1595 family transposase [Paludibacteraceae bacterium]
MADSKDIVQRFLSFKSLDAVYRKFTTEKICREWLAKVRWGDVVVCPHCGSIIVYKSKGLYHCDECNNNFTPLYGTIFQSTKLPLRKWFAAIWLTINNKKGVSSAMLSRELGITQKTAWYLLHKLRQLLPQEEEVLEGDVQVDCGYVGGLLRWVSGRHNPHNEQSNGVASRRRYLRNKVALIGLASADRYVIKVIDEGNWNNIHPILRAYINKRNTIFTDQGKEFLKVSSVIGCEHYTVCHETHNWKNPVTGATTSKVEAAWSHIKRHHKGVYHKLPKRRSQYYIDEFVYRYNTLGLSRVERAADFFKRISVVVPYKQIDNLAQQ